MLPHVCPSKFPSPLAPTLLHRSIAIIQPPSFDFKKRSRDKSVFKPILRPGRIFPPSGVLTTTTTNMSAPTPALAPHKAAFLSSCVTAGALKFGTFTLKSGRISPYFFNAGLFHTASLLDSLTAAYAATLASSAVDFDILFGPAYKGIPLAAATAIQLRTLDDARFGGISYSFNRKEAKDHGEGGSIVGAPLKGKRVAIIDDVITAGTAIREAIEIIKREGGTLVGIVVAFDRLEKTPAKEGEQEEALRGSAIGEVRRQYGIPVLSILTLDDVVEYLKGMGTQEDVKRLEEYRAKYRASD